MLRYPCCDKVAAETVAAIFCIGDNAVVSYRAVFRCRPLLWCLCICGVLLFHDVLFSHFACMLKVKKLLTEMYATTRAAFTKSMLKTDRAVLLPIVYLNVDIRQS